MVKMHRHNIVATAILIAVLSIPSLWGSAAATGPRVSPGLLSPEKNLIFALDVPPFTTSEIPGGGLLSEIVLEALNGEGVDAVIETLPLTRLVRYYLLQDASPAVIAEQLNFTHEERKDLIVVPFYVISGRYFYCKPAHKDLSRWNERLEGPGDHTYGVKARKKGASDSHVGIGVIYDRPVMLFRKLKNGSLDFVSAPDLVANWIIDKRSSDEECKFGRTKTAAWEVPASIVFNKKNPDGEATAKKFIRGLSGIIGNERYHSILEKYHGKGQLPANYKERLEYYQDKEYRTNTWSKPK